MGGGVGERIGNRYLHGRQLNIPAKPCLLVCMQILHDPHGMHLRLAVVLRRSLWLVEGEARHVLAYWPGRAHCSSRARCACMCRAQVGLRGGLHFGGRQVLQWVAGLHATSWVVSC